MLSKSKREFVFLIPIIILSSLLISLCIHDGHNWSGDNALYIEQAQAILDGSIDNLYDISKYANEHSYRINTPHLYPMGFPILLIIPYFFFGLNFIAMKIFSSLFFVFSLPIIYIVFRPYFSHPFYSYCIVLAIAFQFDFVSFSDIVYSDYTFLFFSALSLLCFRKENTLLNQLLIGILIFFSYYIRDVGIALLPALFIYQWQKNHFSGSALKTRLQPLIPYLVFCIFYILNALFLPKGTANHYEHLWAMFSWEIIVKNVNAYVYLFSTYFCVSKTGLLFLMIPFCAGVVFIWRTQLYFVVYVLCVLLIYIIWPALQGMRFLFPILPVIIYIIIKGFEQLVVVLKIPQQFLGVLLITGLCYMTYQSVQRIQDYSRADSNLSYNADTKIMYNYISNNIPKNETIGFSKCRILRLFTKHAVILSDLKHFDESGVNFLLIRKEEITEGTTLPYKIIFQTQTLILVHR